jgi:hypothetical protein
LNSAAVLLPQGRRASESELRIVGAYLGGTVLGSLATVTVVWFVSGFFSVLPERWRVVLLVGGALTVWLTKETSWLRIPLPESKRQIPADIFNQSLVRGAFRFGFELGTGVRTYVPSAAPYVLVLALVLGWLPLGLALLIAAGFGLGRAIPLAMQFAASDRTRYAGEMFKRHDPLTSSLASAVVLIGALSLV